MAARVYCGNINPAATERDLDDEFRRFGPIRSIWVARKPPGFAFIEFEDRRDAEDAIRKLDGSQGWRVEMSRRPQGGPSAHEPDRPARRDVREMRCYECNEVGHIARDCRGRGGGGGGGGGRRASPPRRERSLSPRRRDDSPPRRRRSESPPPRRERDPERDARDREERYRQADDSPRRGRSP